MKAEHKKLRVEASDVAPKRAMPNLGISSMKLFNLAVDRAHEIIDSGVYDVEDLPELPTDEDWEFLKLSLGRDLTEFDVNIFANVFWGEMNKVKE